MELISTLVHLKIIWVQRLTAVSIRCAYVARKG
jgi:hypothetical protein